jgi:hypothetical protein
MVALSGDGMSQVLVTVSEQVKSQLGMEWKGSPHGWVMPQKSGFTLEDICRSVGVDFTYTTEQAAATAAKPAEPQKTKYIGPTKERSGTKSGKPWELLVVSYGNVDHICWDKKIWNLLIANKGKAAILETVPSFDGKKSPIIQGIVRIGDVEYTTDSEGNPKVKKSA